MTLTLHPAKVRWLCSVHHSSITYVPNFKIGRTFCEHTYGRTEGRTEEHFSGLFRSSQSGDLTDIRNKIILPQYDCVLEANWIVINVYTVNNLPSHSSWILLICHPGDILCCWPVTRSGLETQLHAKHFFLHMQNKQHYRVNISNSNSVIMTDSRGR